MHACYSYLVLQCVFVCLDLFHDLPDHLLLASPLSFQWTLKEKKKTESDDMFYTS